MTSNLLYSNILLNWHIPKHFTSKLQWYCILDRYFNQNWDLFPFVSPTPDMTDMIDYIAYLRSINLKALKLSWFWFESWDLMGRFNALWIRYPFRGLSTPDNNDFQEEVLKTYNYVDFLDIQIASCKTQILNFTHIVVESFTAKTEEPRRYWAYAWFQCVKTRWNTLLPVELDLLNRLYWHLSAREMQPDRPWKAD